MAAWEAIAETLFSGGRRDMESLKLGFVTIDRVGVAGIPAVVQETADSCIRLLGKRRRIDTHRATGDECQPSEICARLHRFRSLSEWSVGD